MKKLNDEVIERSFIKSQECSFNSNVQILFTIHRLLDKRVKHCIVNRVKKIKMKLILLSIKSRNLFTIFKEKFIRKECTN